MPGRVAAELHHVEARARHHLVAALTLDGHVGDEVVGAQSGACDQAWGWVTRFIRTVIRSRSS